MLLLAASVVALLVGPALARVAGQRRGPLAMVDGFIVAALLGIVVLDVLPEVLEHAGPSAVAAGLIGVALPRLLEGRLHVAEGQLHGAVTWGAVLGYSLHATLDGAALVGSSGAASALGLGVILHRVPVGVTMWWLVRPRHGVRGAALAVAVIGAATALGYFGAGRLVSALPLGTIGTFQALVGGSLLHVVAGHTHGDEGGAGVHPRWSAAGALVGMASLFAVVHAESDGDAHGMQSMLEFAQRAAPSAIVGLVLSVGAARLEQRSRAVRWLASNPWVGPFELAAMVVALGLFGLKWSLARAAVALVGIAAAHAMTTPHEPTDAEDPAAPNEVTRRGILLAGQLALGAVAAGLLQAGALSSSLVTTFGVLFAAAAGWAVPMSGVAALVAALALQPGAPGAALVVSVVAPLGTRAAMQRAERKVGPRRTLLAVTVGSVASAVTAILLVRVAPWLVADAASIEPAWWDGPAVGVVAGSALGFALLAKLLTGGPRSLVSAVVEPDAFTAGADSAARDPGHAHEATSAHAAPAHAAPAHGAPAHGAHAHSRGVHPHGHRH